MSFRLILHSPGNWQFETSRREPSLRVLLALQVLYRIPLCLRLLQPSGQPAADATSPALPLHSLWQCPLCGGTMRVVERLSAAQLLLRSPPHLAPARRAHWFYVSHSSECSMVVRSRLSDVSAYDHSLCHQQLKRKRTDSKSHLAKDNDRLIEKQIP
jgi:hypothetical protein